MRIITRDARRTVFASILSILLADSALAGMNEWTSLGPDGGRVYDLQVSEADPQTLYAATSNAFYRSIDGGASWQRTTYGTTFLRFYPSQVMPDPANANAVFVLGGDNLILYSTNRGATLSPTNVSTLAPQGAPGRLAAAKSDATIYYIAGSKVFRAENRSFNWQSRTDLPLPTSTSGVAVRTAVDPTNSANVYVFNYGDGLYRSLDGAATWQKVYSGNPGAGEFPRSFALDSMTPSRVWVGTQNALKVSNNSGDTWQTIPLTGEFISVAVDPKNSSIIYASDIERPVLRSSNGGATWTPLTLPARPSWSHVTIDPLDSSKLYLYGDHRVFVSTNAGATWNLADSGIVASTAYQFSSSIGPSGRLYFRTSEYPAYIERDGMRARQSINLGLATIVGADPPNLYSLISVGAGQDILLAVANSQKLARSVDFGGSWNEIGSTLFPVSGSIAQLEASRSGPRLIFATTANGVFRSSDTGDTWIPVNAGLPPPVGTPSNAGIGSISTVNGDPNQVYVHAQGQLYKSMDSGTSWTLLSSFGTKGVVKLVPDPKDSLTLYAVTAQGVFRTLDGGSSWNILAGFPTQSLTAFAVDPIDTRQLYAVMQTVVFRSIDGGATSKRITPDYEDLWWIYDMVANPSVPGQFLIATQGAGVKELTVAPDLEVGLVGPGASVQANSQINYVATFKNLSSLDATNVVAEIDMPNAFSDYTPSFGTLTGSCAPSETKLVCTAALLPGLASFSVTAKTTSTNVGTFAVNGKVSADQADAVQSNNNLSLNVNVSASTAAGGGSSGGGGSTPLWAVSFLVLLWMLRNNRSLRT